MSKLVSFHISDDLDRRLNRIKEVSGVTKSSILTRGLEGEVYNMEKMFGVEITEDEDFAGLARQLQSKGCQSEGQAMEFVNNFMARLNSGEIEVKKVK